MISTQKILTMVILIQIMLGLTATFLLEPENTDNIDKDMKTERDSIQSEETSFTSEEGIWGTVKATAGQVYDSTIGNALKWGASIINFLNKAFNPWAITGEYETEIEKQAANIIQTIRIFLLAITALELYLLFKNKKAT